MRTTRMTLVEMLVALVIFTHRPGRGAGGPASQVTRLRSRLGRDGDPAEHAVRRRPAGPGSPNRAVPICAATSRPWCMPGTTRSPSTPICVSDTSDIFCGVRRPRCPGGQVAGYPLGGAQSATPVRPAFSYPLATTPGTWPRRSSSSSSRTPPRPMPPISGSCGRSTISAPRSWYGTSCPTRADVLPVLLREQPGRIDTVPTAWYPMSHFDAQYTGDETGLIGRINLLRATEVSFSVSNGRAGTAQRTQQMSFIVSLPNTGIDQVQTCGATPILGCLCSPLLAGPPARRPST